MPASTHDRLYVSAAQYLGALLTEQQYLFPHRTISATMHHLASKCGWCKKDALEIAQAIFADAQRPLGRLSRAEILDLARRLAPVAAPGISDPRVPDHQDARAA